MKIDKFTNKEHNQSVNQLFLIDILKDCYNSYAFSTFPYINYNFDSSNSIEYTNSGNCIALSIKIKNILKNKYNIESYLIPATIPKKFYHEGFLNISHVALAIPKNNNIFYIVDPAFYFINPIKINLKKKETNQSIYLKNIYSKEITKSKHPKNYTSIDKIIAKQNRCIEDLIYNDYQNIPKDTIFSECYFDKDKLDKWYYFLVEILNPDESITSFFINILNRPFICTTNLDSNNICQMEYYIKFLNNNHLLIENPNDDLYLNIDLKNIKEDELKKKLKNIDKKTKKYFINGLSEEIIKYYNKINTNQ